MSCSLSPRFVGDRHDLDAVLAGARQIACPHCRRVGTVVGHGLLVGYAEHGSERVVRGRRLLCSRRFRRSGCGRTFSVLLATVLAGFTVRTRPLSQLLEWVVGGLCRKAAWQRASSHLTLRHTTAMHLLQSGVDITVIALWLGHESPATTHLYIEADLAMKERALKKLSAPPTASPRYRASDRLLAFLEGL